MLKNVREVFVPGKPNTCHINFNIEIGGQGAAPLLLAEAFISHRATSYKPECTAEHAEYIERAETGEHTEYTEYGE